LKMLKGRHRDAFMTSMSPESTRTAPTVPPPPPGAIATELDKRVSELRTIAAQILARANDLEMVADKARGAL
jgi:hypothetical protein